MVEDMPDAEFAWPARPFSQVRRNTDRSHVQVRYQFIAELTVHLAAFVDRAVRIDDI